MPFAITKSGFKINYKICGEFDAEHTIILSHGNGNCLNDWEVLGYVERLTPKFRIILMDALGYGESDKPRSSQYYTSEQRAKDVIAVLDTVQIDKCHFFGNSIGGSLGFVLAHLYPERFLSYMIGSAHPYGSTKECSNLYDEEFKNRIAQDGVEKFVSFVETELLNRKFPVGVRENFLRNVPNAIVSANTPIWPDYSPYLRDIVVPVMLFAGEKDPVTNYIREYSTQIPNCTINILENKDHAQAYWEAENVVPAMLNFMEEQAALTSMRRLSM